MIDDDGRVLLHRRSDNGRWSILSGILDPGEQPASGVVREVWEETGVQVVVERLTSVTVSPQVVHPNGDHVQYLELTFRCRVAGGSARVNDDESVEVGWFPPDSLPNLDAGSVQKIGHALRGDAEAWFADAQAMAATEAAFGHGSAV